MTTDETRTLQTLIENYESLLRFYSDTFDRFVVKRRTGPTLVKRTVPERFYKIYPKEAAPLSQKDIECLRKGYDILAVEKPFYSPYFQKVGDSLTEGQSQAQAFQNQYLELRQRLESFCRRTNTLYLLSDLPATDITSADGDRIVNGLALHITKLKEELATLRDPQKDEAGKTPERDTVNRTTSEEVVPGGSKRRKSGILSWIAVKKMDAYLDSKGMRLTDFAAHARTTDRTLRSFRKKGKLRQDIFEAVATAMGTTKENLMKAE